MYPYAAKMLVSFQNKKLSDLNGKRFIHNRFEYEIRYEGGFTAFVSLFRREVGRRNFKYFKGCGCYDCINNDSALKKIYNLLP